MRLRATSSCNTRLRPGLTEFCPVDYQRRDRNYYCWRNSTTMHQQRLRPIPAPFIRGFAPVLLNFVLRTLSAATGIIIEASPHIQLQYEASPRPYRILSGELPAQGQESLLSAELHDMTSTVCGVARQQFYREASPPNKLPYEASPRPYRILSGGLLARIQESLLLAKLHDVACTN